MATIQEIINYAERYYPRTTLISTANKVLDLNDIHNTAYLRLKRLKNDFEIYEIYTIANEPFYSLPGNCRIDDILKIEVSDDVSDLTSSQYFYSGLNDDIGIGNYFGRVTEGLFYLFSNGYPINITGLVARLYYYPRPALLLPSVLTAVPDLDLDYHDLLKFGLIQAMASQGHDPDYDIADHWQAEYDTKMALIEENLKARNDNAPLRRAEMKERM